MDRPRLELDDDLVTLIQHAQEVLVSQDRLRGLLQASRRIVGDLDLDVVLNRIVSAARDLVDADFAALGVIGPEGTGLERFVHVGLDDETVTAIGHLPEGKGLLGLLIDDPRPIRLRDLREDPHAVGFPDHHPEMQAFIGVPIRAREEVFGNLYLTRREGKEFTDDDEAVVMSLAGTAGIAIENARLFEDGRRRQEWLATSTEVTRRLLAEPTGEPLELIADSVFRLSEADLVTVAQVTEAGDMTTVRVAVGAGADAVTGATYALENTFSELVLESGGPMRLADASDTHAHGTRRVFLADKVDLGPAIIVPLMGAAGPRGVLWAARRKHAHPFSPSDEDTIAAFANQASIAWELADARRAQQRVDLLEDRARIARDLHDHVIQRLFAAGLGLQALAMGAGDLAPKLEGVVDEIDDVIRQIRNSIFHLRPVEGGMRAAILDVVGEARSGLGFEPHVVFDGPIDNVSTPDLLNDVTAVLREALTNVAKHANATTADVRVDVRDHQLRVVVVDNGRGLGVVSRSSGMGNMRTRAESRDGTLVVEAATKGTGTSLQWRVPLSRRSADDAG
ncbi:two-component system sensor histidine kinase [Nocardioides panacihumi]|uniref:Two-component system sensor histidine kinase n=1 Tax=Nocardioides panacihumi TaxID=400774 RepID=A0ABP5D904_9ACTN